MSSMDSLHLKNVFCDNKTGSYNNPFWHNKSITDKLHHQYPISLRGNNSTQNGYITKANLQYSKGGATQYFRRL